MEKLTDVALLLDRCVRQNLIDSKSVSSIHQHIREMIILQTVALERRYAASTGYHAQTQINKRKEKESFSYNRSASDKRHVQTTRFAGRSNERISNDLLHQCLKFLKHADVKRIFYNKVITSL